MQFRLFNNEQIDKQEEKNIAYIQAGFKLTKQHQEHNGTIIREYTIRKTELSAI